MSSDSRQYHLDRYYSIKAKAVDYLGGKCVVCGTINDLEFDHIDPQNKEFTIGNKMFIPWQTLLIELDKCQLLCDKHHKEKHSTEHGSLRMYTNYKCRCDLCRTTWNENSRIYRQQIRNKKFIGDSSNGRTEAFDASYVGSNPTSPSNLIRLLALI